MTTTMGYNGYTNYETWNVSLWINNDEGSYDYWRHEAEEAYRDAVGNAFLGRDRVAVHALADLLRETFTDNMPELKGTYSDLLSAALGSVDWYEIATGMVEEAIEHVEEDADDDN